MKCPRCGKLPTRVGCKCAPAPEDFPRRDPETGLWFRPSTGELLAAAAPAAVDVVDQAQLQLLDLGQADVAREGVAAVRAALRT